MYVQFIKVQIMAYTGGHFFVFMQPFLALPAGPKVECRFSVLPRLPPFFASLCTVTGVNEARLAMITPFIGITKKTERRKSGSVAGGRGSSSEEFQRGTVLLSNTEHYFIHLVLRVVCVLHVFRRSHSPHLITGRDVVVLDEAVIILLVHRRLLSVAPGTVLRGKLNLKAWEANIKKGLLENVNKSQRAKDN